MSVSVEDVVAIEQLNARYAHATDQGDGERFAACFGEDGVFVSSKLGEIRGLAALAEFARNAASQPGAAARCHWISSVLAERSDDQVTSRCYAMVVEGGAQPRIVASVIYEDLLNQSDLGWRFLRRTVRILG
jgi:uncharacterized protein (TIGR02246 family)